MVDETKLEGLGRYLSNGQVHEINHLELEAVWHDKIYQIENKSATMTGDKAVGGANGVANIQAKELGDRTEWLYMALNNILSYLYSYTPEGSTKIRTVISAEKPDDPTKLWLKISGETETDVNPEVMVRFENGEVFNIFDGKTIFTIDGIRYALVGENDVENYSPIVPTIPSDTTSGGEDTLPSDTVPADDTLPGGNDTITIPGGDDDTNWADQHDVDTLISDIWGDDDG